MTFTPLQHPRLRVVYHNLTIAEANAGFQLVPPSPERYYTVVDAWARAAGNVTECTSFDVTDGHTVAALFAAAALTNGTFVRCGATNTTSTVLGTRLAKGHGITAITTDTNESTATAIEVCVYYVVSTASAD